MTPADIITPARAILADEVGNRVQHYDDDDLLLWVNEGALRAATLVPRSTAQNVVMDLAAGTRQVLQPGWLMLLEVHNLVGGDHLNRIDRRDADAATPGWMNEVGTPCEYVLHDDEQKAVRDYWVVPGPADGSMQLNITVSVDPSVAALDAEMLIPVEYKPALTDYVVARALEKHHKEGNASAAARHLNAYHSQLGVMPGEQNPQPRYRGDRFDRRSMR